MGLVGRAGFSCTFIVLFQNYILHKLSSDLCNVRVTVGLTDLMARDRLPDIFAYWFLCFNKYNKISL